MTLHLFDSATRTTRELVPLRPGHVGLYVCGATVQGPPHIGHVKTAVGFDVLVRWLRRSGLEVTFVRNVTDIDDKILERSAEAGVPWWAWAHRFEREFTAAYDAVGILPPTYEPRATGHVVDMVELMDRLLDKGHAYPGDDGDVWFDVRSWPEYGALTNQRPEDVPASDDAADAAEGAGKRDPRDFALWKSPKPGEPLDASWPTPYGRGRPGWHLECSAMARRYLGSAFDIHGGGRDLRFPHHENELAQSRAAGDGFAGIWLHAGLLNVDGAKMSKSLGNFLLVADVLATTAPVVLRYALTAAHYRSTLEWNAETLPEAEATWARIAGFVERATERVREAGLEAPGALATVDLPPAFAAALDDDLNVPAGLAVVHEHVRAGNIALADGTPDEVRAALVAVRAMLDALGLDPVRWAGTGDDSRATRALGALVTAELAARAQARAERDWATADAVRARLAEAGIVVEDSPTGPRWTLGGEG